MGRKAQRRERGAAKRLDILKPFDADPHNAKQCTFRACEKIACDVVQTFRSARHGRPEGLHYSDFFTGPSGLPLRLELERHAIHAVARLGRGWTVREQMPEVSAAVGAVYLYTRHE